MHNGTIILSGWFLGVYRQLVGSLRRCQLVKGILLIVAHSTSYCTSMVSRDALIG